MISQHLKELVNGRCSEHIDHFKQTLRVSETLRVFEILPRFQLRKTSPRALGRGVGAFSVRPRCVLPNPPSNNLRSITDAEAGNYGAFFKMIGRKTPLGTSKVPVSAMDKP